MFINYWVGSFNILGVYLRSTIAIFVISLFAYVGGSGLGSAIGISMGFIIGITNNDIATYNYLQLVWSYYGGF